MEALFCLALILVSAFLSATEVSLFSLTKFQLRVIRENFEATYQRIRTLIGDPPGLLVTILVLNEIVNVSLSTVITRVITRNAHYLDFLPDSIPKWMAVSLVGVLVITPIILLFCEIIPKVTGIRLNQIIATMNSRIILLAYQIFKPLRIILKTLINLFTGRPDPVSMGSDLHVKEEEFMQLAEEGARQGNIKQSELELIRKVFELDDRKVKEIYTPMASVNSLPRNTKLPEALKLLSKRHHNRLPVYNKVKKHVIGVLYAKDLLVAQTSPGFDDKTVEALMEEPIFAPESMQLNTLFRNLKNQKIHLAIVQDERGESVGIVTMHDVLDELFEGIHES